ncbi:MAG: hypothetical protein ABJA86_07860 [Nocardioidaceae bacterium]
MRFAWSPIWGTQTAVQAFDDERARSYHQPWHRRRRHRTDPRDQAGLTPGRERGRVAPELTADQLARLDAIPPPVGDRYADMTRISR